MSKFTALPHGPFSLIVADPPWHFATWSAQGRKKSTDQHYKTLSFSDIEALDVASVAAPDAVLVIWATAPLLPQAIQLLGTWGFTYKTAGAWAKQSSTGRKWQFGTGYIFRSAAEFYVLGTRGAPTLNARNVRNLTVAPVREHSRKPDETFNELARLVDGPRLELFARSPRPNWTVWGDEAARPIGVVA